MSVVKELNSEMGLNALTAAGGLAVLKDGAVLDEEVSKEPPWTLDYWGTKEWAMCGSYDIEVSEYTGVSRYTWPDVYTADSNWCSVLKTRSRSIIMGNRGTGLFAKRDIEVPTLYPYGGEEIFISAKDVKEKKGKSYLIGNLGLPCGLVNADPVNYPVNLPLDGWIGSLVNECAPGEKPNGLLVELDKLHRSYFKNMRCIAWNACPGSTNYGLLILPGVKADEEILVEYNYTSADSKGLKYVNRKAKSIKCQKSNFTAMYLAKKRKHEHKKVMNAKRAKNLQLRR